MSELAPVDLATAKAGHACRQCGSPVSHTFVDLKGNTLLNYCGIGPDFLDFTVDRNPYKHGRFTPGMHVPILPPEAIDNAKPDYVLILPWNLKAEIMRQMHHIGDWGAKFIVPIPIPVIVEPGETR